MQVYSRGMTENEAGREAGPAGTPQVHYVNARTLRGLAHPLRMRLLNTLREFGPATASGLAGRLGESSGATSYHLRQLASYGFVEDAPELGKGRERWWKAVHLGTAFDNTADFLRDPDPEVRDAMGVILHEVSTTHAQELSTWLGTMHTWPEEWLHSWDLSDFKVRLTPELSKELAEKIHDLVNSYRGQVPEDTEGSAVVRTHLHVFPRSSD